MGVVLTAGVGGDGVLDTRRTSTSYMFFLLLLDGPGHLCSRVGRVEQQQGGQVTCMVVELRKGSIRGTHTHTHTPLVKVSNLGSKAPEKPKKGPEEQPATQALPIFFSHLPAGKSAQRKSIKHQLPVRHFTHTHTHPIAFAYHYNLTNQELLSQFHL